MNRRHFVTLLASVPCAVPPLARVKAAEAVRRVGMLVVNAQDDPEGQARVAAFRRALAERGWIEGRNVRIDLRWGASDPDRVRAQSADLLALKPDVIVANGSPGLSVLKRATNSVPIVFVVVTDPLGAGYVRSLRQPGGNITGFSTFEPQIGGKWLGLLKEIAPGVRRVACIVDPAFTGFAEIWREIEHNAPALALRVSSIVFRDRADDLESAVASFAGAGDGGLIVAPTAINNAARDRIISLATRHRLPAVYPFQHFADAGGLLAYGFDALDIFARSAAYVDRILKGEKPGDLPVQGPLKFEMVVNLRTARGLGLQLSPLLLARADRVIE